jgi:hypothetical protein
MNADLRSSGKICGFYLTIASPVRYKPNTMFRTDRGHHAYWHHHHTGGGLAIVFAALTEAS